MLAVGRLSRCLYRGAGLRTWGFRFFSAHNKASGSSDSGSKKVTLLDWRKHYETKMPISVTTAYDYPSALLADRAGLDCILVGDSLAMVALGYDSTLTITLEVGFPDVDF